MDMTTYTIGDNPENVNVAEFRNRIDHLEDVFYRDRHACVGAAEKAYNIRIIRSVGAVLINTTCKRAKKVDWDRRELILDDSVSYLSKVL